MKTAHISLVLDQKQTASVVSQYLNGITHKDAVSLLKQLVVQNFHDLDHIQLVHDFQTVVQKECALPIGYFKEGGT